jgi:hypothetical protein
VSRSQANSSLSGNHQRRTAKIHRSVRWSTGLSGESTVSRGNGRPSQRSAGAMVSQRSHWCTGLSGVHRTVSGAPAALRLQRSASPSKEGDLHRTVSSGTPDCPVRQSTEGKICLPGLFSTAPSCLGAIKGTPRRMEEHTKHSYNIPKHKDLDSAHLFLCDSI